MQCMIEALARLPLFVGLDDDALKALMCEAPSRSETYEQGTLVALQGESIKSLPLLLSGSVRAQMTSPEGKRLTVDNISAPEVLASAFVYSTEGKYPVSIEAVEPCLVWHLDKEYFLTYMTKHDTVMRAFLGMISDRCGFLSQKLNALSLQSLRERLINYLQTHDNLGKQEEIALLLGVTRPSLARLLGELVEEGVLIKEAQSYRLRVAGKV